MCINLHKSKGLPKYIKISIIPLNECSNFRPKSIGESLKEPMIKLRYEELTPYQYPRHRGEEQIKPYEPTKILNAPMLQTNVPYDQRRHNALVNSKLS